MNRPFYVRIYKSGGCFFATLSSEPRSPASAWISTKGEIFLYTDWINDGTRYKYYFNSYRWIMSEIKKLFFLRGEVHEVMRNTHKLFKVELKPSCHNLSARNKVCNLFSE